MSPGAATAFGTLAAGAFAAVAAFTAGSAGAPRRAPVPRVRGAIAVIGHRAGAGIAPENTLAAIRQAIRLGVDYAEIDVRTTRDGALVIMHDATVDRTTDGHGAVRDLSLAAVRRLAVINRFGSGFRDERVPTLDEVLALCRGKINVYFDHKDADTRAALAALRAQGMERHVLVYNGVEGVKQWKRLAPGIPVMPGLPDAFRKPGGVAAFESSCPTEAWTVTSTSGRRNS